ncbi:winged helix-turn-helix domain-containing protein [Actinomadura bangladeshensis]|uniref:Winged helix-turn-helix transcriptional regulator n=1 Tax=Actinomadura bangladeshensis TaxID=453573 RepID=A0A6L9QEJ9_9ACTN|nr:winged helix-turn-helix domain-containing protein [Actinomadura bangladeshensis]NEA22614.1 winged helix-turn-helix transcriptional regulator [Actinomadura bangladeshensis]
MDRTPVDPTSDRPVVKQVADRIRTQIQDGVFQPGQVLPGEHHMTEWFGVSRASVREALTILRGEGLVETIPRVGTRVRAERAKATVPIAAGVQVTARMPSEAERREYALPLGVPVMVLTHPDGTMQVLPADRFAVVAGDEV